MKFLDIDFKSLIVLTLIVSTMFFISCGERDFIIHIPVTQDIQALPFRYQDVVIIPCLCAQKPCIKAISTNNGQEKWTLSTEIPLWSHGLSGTPHIYKNTWVAVVDSIVYLIDLDNGHITSQKTFDGYVDNFLSGHGDDIFLIVQNSDTTQSTIYRWNLKTGDIKAWKEYTFPYTASINIKGPIPLDDDKFMHSLLIYQPNISTHNYFCYLDDSGVLLDSLPLDSINFKGVGVTRPPLRDEAAQKYFWHTVDGMVATDLHTGGLLWNQKYNKAMMAARPILWDDFLLYPSDSREFLLLDKASGDVAAVLDTVPNVPSRLYTSGGHLYCTDISGVFHQLTYTKTPPHFSLKSLIHKDKKPVFPSFYADDDIMVLHIGDQWMVGTPELFLNSFHIVNQ